MQEGGEGGREGGREGKENMVCMERRLGVWARGREGKAYARVGREARHTHAWEGRREGGGVAGRGKRRQQQEERK